MNFDSGLNLDLLCRGQAALNYVLGCLTLGQVHHVARIDVAVDRPQAEPIKHLEAHQCLQGVGQVPHPGG